VAKSSDNTSPIDTYPLTGPQAPEFQEFVDAHRDLAESTQNIKMRKTIIHGTLVVIVGVFVVGFTLITLYGLGLLPRFEKEEFRWIAGTLLTNAFALIAYTWRAASAKLFKQ